MDGTLAGDENIPDSRARPGHADLGASAPRAAHVGMCGRWANRSQSDTDTRGSSVHALAGLRAAVGRE